MEPVKAYLEQIRKEAVLAVALLEALNAFELYNSTYIRCDSQLLLIDFTEEIALVKTALILLRVDPEQAKQNRIDGMWF